jgi:uncharacterized membrane protein YidH (DUF202 family)
MSDAPNIDPRVAWAAKRTTLASFRTAQALDRTTLAWVRTTLTMGSFGVGMIGFFRTSGVVSAVRWSCIGRASQIWGIIGCLSVANYRPSS